MNSLKLKSLLKTILFLAVLGVAAYYLNRPSGEAPRSTPTPAARDVRGESRQPAPTPDARSGFASREKLIQHYRKHGAEFGSVSMEEYLRRAQDLRDRKRSTDVLEFVRPDGIVSRFEKSTGTFVAFNANGIIRTCFKPNDGEAYFHRQKTKAH